MPRLSSIWPSGSAGFQDSRSKSTLSGGEHLGEWNIAKKTGKLARLYQKHGEVDHTIIEQNGTPIGVEPNTKPHQTNTSTQKPCPPERRYVQVDGNGLSKRVQQQKIKPHCHVKYRITAQGRPEQQNTEQHSTRLAKEIKLENCDGLREKIKVCRIDPITEIRVQYTKAEERAT